jgi:hypothetical protein
MLYRSQRGKSLGGHSIRGVFTPARCAAERTQGEPIRRTATECELHRPPSSRSPLML